MSKSGDSSHKALFLLIIIVLFAVFAMAADEKTISIDLLYMTGTPWDSNDDGIEISDGVIDFTVDGTSFNWEVDESKLCTKWEVYSYDHDTTTRACFGSADCCALMDLIPASLSWDDAFELYVGRFGAGLLNNITAQVLYADYSFDAEDPFSELYHSDYSSLMADFSLVPEAVFERTIVCDNCSGNKIPPLTNFVMVVSAGINTYFDGVLADYFPSAFILLDKESSNTIIDDNISKVEWDVAGDSFSRNYTLLSPNSTGNYTFFSSLGEYDSEEWLVAVDHDIECVLPNVSFDIEDMQASANSAVFDDGRVMVALNGVDVDKVKAPSFVNNILSMDSVDISNATISLPRCSSPVVGGVKLFVKKDDDFLFSEAEPYCFNKTIVTKRNVTVKGKCDNESGIFCTFIKDKVIEVVENDTVVDYDNCYNEVKVTPTHYVFRVEHFSDYYVNGSDYDNLVDCHVAHNNTLDKCIVSADGHSEYFNDTYSFRNVKTEISADDVLIDFNRSFYSYTPTSDTLFRADEGNDNITIRNLIHSGGQRHLYLKDGTNFSIESYTSIGTLDDDYFNNMDGINVSNSVFNDSALHIVNTDNSTWFNVSNINSDTRAAGDDGVWKINGNNNTIINSECVLADSSTGDTTSCMNIQSGKNNTVMNSIFNGKDKIGIEIDGNGAYFNYIINNTIVNGSNGIYSEFIVDYIIGNTIYNTSEEGIYHNDGAVGNGYGEVINNTVVDCGSAHSELNEDYRVSYYPFNISGVKYDTCVVFVDDTGSYSTLVSSDNTTLGSWMNSSKDFDRCWAYTDTNNIVGCGAGALITLCLEEDYPNSCADIVSAYGGSCDYFMETDAIVSNGAGNDFTWNETLLSDTNNTNVTNPPYLVYGSWTDYIQDYYPFRAEASGNELNITGNTVINNGENYFSAIIVGSSGANNYTTNVWLNDFYDGVNVSGDRYGFCVNGEGNYYSEDADVVSGDCGPVNFTVPVEGEEYGGLLNLSWQEQSSMSLINYSLFYSNGSNYYFIDSTTDLSYLWTVPGDPAQTNLTIKIVPFDGLYNATNVFVSFLKGEVDVHSLSLLYNSSIYSIFEFFVQNIDVVDHNISWEFRPGTGETNITSNEDINLTSDGSVIVFIERNYTSIGSYNVTAKANTSLSDDEESVGVTIT